MKENNTYSHLGDSTVHIGDHLPREMELIRVADASKTTKMGYCV